MDRFYGIVSARLWRAKAQAQTLTPAIQAQAGTSGTSAQTVAMPKATLINLTLIGVALCICSFHYANATLK
jgi:hypothetical protein